MRLFDIRNFKGPVQSWYDLYNNSPNTSVCLSPDEKYVITGTSNTKSELGSIVIFSTSPGDDYKQIGKIPVAEGKINSIAWPEELNQIVVAAGNDIKIFYCPNMSQRGALLGARRQVRKAHVDDFEYKKPIFNPHALPLFNENHKNRIKSYESKRTDSEINHKPEIPLAGPGKQGKISGPNTLTQNIMATINRVNYDKKIDPRDAVARFAKEALENPEYIDSAYQFTQPKKILDYDSQEHEEQKLMSMYAKCPKCG